MLVREPRAPANTDAKDLLARGRLGSAAKMGSFLCLELAAADVVLRITTGLFDSVFWHGGADAIGCGWSIVASNVQYCMADAAWLRPGLWLDATYNHQCQGLCRTNDALKLPMDN